MNRATRQVVIVGGGSAGWITANVLAARLRGRQEHAPQITLVESAEIPTIGVGEGTWPSMRGTLQRIGLAEAEFLRACDASLKQGTRFLGWDDTGRGAYTHPFSWPVDYASVNPAWRWLRAGRPQPFAEAVTPQAAVIARGQAPKQAGAPPYAFTVNYGYHLNAGKFGELLRRHAQETLGVAHIAGTVSAVESHPDGDIAALALADGRRIEGDLFIDCTGHRGRLIGEHYGCRRDSAADVLFNDAAIVAQVPYAEQAEPIASATLATAQPAGWVWDIGLQTRRGLGYVYSTAHESEEGAVETLREYVGRTSPGTDADALDYRALRFQPGYRAAFWKRNCVAVGLSAGFIEPLEASALALVEQAADAIGRQFPLDREIMDVVARRFDDKMRYHWERIIDFLKLHYAACTRHDTAYWQDNRSQSSWPASLRDKLALWQQQPPWHDDAPMVDELFPSASYQYVLYGLGFEPRYAPAMAASTPAADETVAKVREQTRRLTALLPANRDLLRAILHGDEETQAA